MRRWFLITAFLLSCCGAACAMTAMETAGEALKAQKEGRLERACELWAEAARLFAEEGNEEAGGRAWFFYAGARFDNQQDEEALLGLARAKEAFRAVDSTSGLALVALQEGVTLRRLSRWLESEQALLRCIELSSQAGDTSREAEGVDQLGFLYEVARRWREALEMRLRLVNLYRETQPKKVPDGLKSLGAVYQVLGETELAERAYAESSESYLALGRPREAREMQERLAGFLLDRGRYSDAEALYRTLRDLYAGSGKAHQVGLTLSEAIMEQGREEEALQLINELEREQLGPRLGPQVQLRKLQLLVRLKRDSEALTLLEGPVFTSHYQRAEAAELVGWRARAESYLRQAWSEAPSEETPIYANALAVKLMGWGKTEEAAKVLREGLSTVGVRDEETRAPLRSNLALCLFRLGQAEQAVPYFRSGAEDFLRLGKPIKAATALSNLGAAYESMGQYEPALRALERAAEAGDRYHKAHPIHATIANSRGLVYVKLGRIEDGISLYKQALSINRSFQNREGVIANLNNLGTAYQVLDRKEPAMDCFREAYELASEQGRKRLQATLSNNLGLLSSDPAEAQRYLETSLRLAVETGDRRHQVKVLANLASESVELGRDSEAEERAEQAALLSAELRDRSTELQSLEILFGLQRLDFPRNRIERALELSEEQIKGLSARSARTFVQQRRDLFERALLLALNQQDPEFLLSLEERYRALGLAALTRGVDLTSAHIPAALARREQSLAGRLRELAQQEYQDGALERERELRREYRLVLDRIEREHRAAGAVHKLRWARLDEVQKALEDGEFLVEYLEIGGWLHALVIGKEKAVHHRLASLERVQRLTGSAYRAVVRPGRLERAERHLGELAEAVWQPLEQELPTDSKVVIVPSGGLYAIPFGALYREAQPLNELYLLSTASSASAWLVSRRSPTAASGTSSLLTALGNHTPDMSHSKAVGAGGARGLLSAPLPASLTELEGLVSMLPGAVQLREEEMTREALHRQSQGKRLLHYATHGILNQEEPMFSGLVAADGLVTAADIFRWKLAAELAVLSACHTGQQTDGQEYVSLTRAFQFAGARSLLASLWAVNDEATADWMGHFYEALQNGDTAAEAARLARRRIRAEHPHPFYWAPFTLWGDGSVLPVKSDRTP